MIYTYSRVAGSKSVPAIAHFVQVSYRFLKRARKLENACKKNALGIILGPLKSSVASLTNE